LARALRLSVICHGVTTTSRSAVFPGNEALADGQAEKAAKTALFLPRAETALAAPEQRTQETATAMGFDYAVGPEFRDLDYGRWIGLSLAEISANEPENLAQWVSDVGSAPHGGETIARMIGRISTWMDAHLQWEGHHVIVTHAAVIRAMVLTALQAPPQSFWSVDVEHLGVTDLRSDGRRWALRSFGRILHK
jgi:broad specificity phosphatase PhoE